jgi:hypothetical protein
MRERSLPESALRLLEDEFIFVLLNKGYSIASRSDVESIIREMRFQHSGLTDQDAARLGKLLNVPAVLIVSVTQLRTEPYEGYKVNYQPVYYDTTAAMGARLISVEKGEILWFGKHKGTYRVRADREGTESLVSLARTIAGSFPPRGR